MDCDTEMAQRKDSSPDARHSLSTELVEALTRDFREHGVATIQKLRETDPKAYCQTISAVIPKELLIGADHGTETNAPKNSDEIATALLRDVGFDAPDADEKQRALDLYDALIAGLENIRDRAIGFH